MTTTPAATTPAQDTHRSRRSRRLRRGIVLLVLLALAAGTAVVLGTGFGRDPGVVRSALIGRPAPPLAGPTLDGGKVDLRDYRGKIVLVNVWASWCPACRREHPILVDTQHRLGPRGLQVVGINMKDTRRDAQRLLDDMGGSTYPSLFDPDARHAIEWGTFAIPETYIVDREGVILKKAVGAITREWIDTEVVPLLERP